MKTSQFIATAVTAAVLATAGVSVAGATAGTSPTPASAASTVAASSTRATPAQHAARRKHLRLLVRKGAIKVAAAKIGIKPAEVRKDLRGGQTIAAIATAHHVAPQAVIDAIVAAGRTRIAAAQSAGKITAEQASKLDARLPARATTFVDTWLPKHHS